VFAPKLFQTRTKQAAPSVGPLVLRPPVRAGARSGPPSVQQALVLQRLVGNQATTRLLARRSMRGLRESGGRDKDAPVGPIAPLLRAAELYRLGPNPLHAKPAIVARAPAEAEEILSPPSNLSSTATPGWHLRAADPCGHYRLPEDPRSGTGCHHRPADLGFPRRPHGDRRRHRRRRRRCGRAG